MEQLKLLEMLAHSALPHSRLVELDTLSPELKEVFLTNDIEKLKALFATTTHFANESHVVRV